MAPECFPTKSLKEQLTDKADVFSLGVILFKLLQDRDPFSIEELECGQLDYDQLYFDDRISNDCKTFIEKLLEF